MKYKLFAISLFFNALLANAQLNLNGGVIHVNAGGSLTVEKPATLANGSTFYINGGTATFTNSVSNLGTPLWTAPGANFSTQSGTWYLYPGSAAANLTIGGTALLIVGETETVELSGTANITSTTGGLQVDGSATTYGQLKASVITGGGRIVRQMPLTSITGWRQLSFPVNTSLSTLTTELIINNNTTPAAQQNAFWWDANPLNAGGALPADAVAKGWQAVSPTEVLSPTKPLNIFVGAPYFPANWSYLEVEGTTPSNNQTFPVFATNYLPSGGSANTIGWQMVGNPYLCNLDVSTLLVDAINFPLAYKAVHVWDPTLQQYRVMTATSSVPAVNGNGNVVNLPPMQAFWVKGTGILSSSSTPEAQITLTPAHQTLSTTPLYNFKDAPPHVRLTAKNLTSGLGDEILIQHVEATKPDVEPAWDAFKLRSLVEEAPYLAVRMPEADLSIHTSQFLEENRYSILLQLEQANGGSFEFSAAQVGFEGFDIWLENPTNGAMFNLKTETPIISITSKQALYLHLGNWGSNLTQGTFARVISSEGNIRISLDGQPDELNEVHVYNLIGQQLYEAKVNAAEHSFILPNREAVVLIKMFTKSGKVLTEKVTALH